jgi:hypothetical protein
VILDNSPQQDLDLPDFAGEIIKPVVPLYCNQSYNFILKLAQERKQEVFFVMHSDATVSWEVLERLLEIADELNRQQRPWGVLFTVYDVLCLYRTQILKDFAWDPYLPMYYTDVDYYHRLHLAGVEMVETGLRVGHQEGGSTTVNADTALNTFIQSNYAGWRHYYMQKWGGERDQERYPCPFNQSETSWPGVSVSLYPGKNR